MNVYLTKNYVHNFIENLKEIQIIDEYILDEAKTGKEKIKLLSKADTYEIIEKLIPLLPEKTIIVDQIDCPGEQYILCVGELTFSDFSFLKEQEAEVSIITINGSELRFTAWIKPTKLESLFKSDKIKNLSSLNGKIEKETYFCFETKECEMDAVHDCISEFSNEFIIKAEKIYVKLLLFNFTKVATKIQTLVNRIEIFDESNF